MSVFYYYFILLTLFYLEWIRNLPIIWQKSAAILRKYGALGS